jgi:hypothetical protein
MNGEIKDWAGRYKEIGFDAKLKHFSEEVFRIVEWTTLVAAVGYVGAKFSSSLLTYASYALAVLLSIYIGNRSVYIVAGLQGAAPGALTGWGWRVLLAAPITFGSIWLIMYVIGYLVKAQVG